jgi:hypothetical protein
LLASPRGLSQLATSFFAYLRQGIHTHALSSLTIKFTLNTELFSQRAWTLWPTLLSRYRRQILAAASPQTRRPWFRQLFLAAFATFVVARQYSIFKELYCPRGQKSRPGRFQILTSSHCFLVGLDRLELSTSPLSGARSSHLSYRPIWWSWSGSNRRPPECKSGALPTELQPLTFA